MGCFLTVVNLDEKKSLLINLAKQGIKCQKLETSYLKACLMLQFRILRQII